MPAPLREPSIEDRLRRMTPVAAPPEEHEDVSDLSRALVRYAHSPDFRTPQLIGPRGERIPIPESVFHVLVRVAEVMARGDAITLVPVGKQLTTQQAADLLNVSRQYLVRILDEGRIPFTRAGKHRRLRFDDVLAFKEKRDLERAAALSRLTRDSEDVGGYKELD